MATNTSAISITEIAAKTKARDRVVGTHFWNPPYLVPLVEVIGGRDTSTEVKDYACSLLKSVGKHPVVIKRDVPGFVGNRLQHALWREAISIVERGIGIAQVQGDAAWKKALPTRKPWMKSSRTDSASGSLFWALLRMPTWTVSI